MSEVNFLWADLRLEHSPESLYFGMPERFHGTCVRSSSEIQSEIRKNSPSFLCFEYDHPVQEQLHILRDARLAWPFLPVLMITVDHSEALAIWALRMRVWDYVVMPVTRDELCVRVALLTQDCDCSDSCQSGGPLGMTYAKHMESAPPRFEKAMSFVEENLTEKISLREVAQLCGLGPFQFSRAFKQDRGTTFREFLIQRRVNRALQLFGNPKASVTEVAFAAGFNDLSYFARVFRRFVGVSPSLYRREKGIREVAGQPTQESPENHRAVWPIAKYFYPPARES
jgi:AraC-like DNA-binding protein